MSKLGLVLVALLCVVTAELSAARDVDPAAPIPEIGDPYAFARGQKSDAPKPTDYPGIHNVVRLSANIVSGSEPHGEKALERIAAMGVKTILSVDGKVPDAALAKKHGMRYVHVPIQYSGITKDELAKIAKTFRELPGPFFVHCFHGKHRGPAAAAVGRVVLDGAPREKAMAEMVHCGVAGKYEGLYRTIGAAPMPTAEATKTLRWGFDEAHPIEGIRGGMIEITRSFDHLKALGKRGFEADPDHPDIDAANEASKVAQLYDRMNAGEELSKKPAPYRKWMKESVAASRALLKALEAGKPGLARKHLLVTKNLCASCHKAYRNHR